jgi:hypothetical protein
VSQISPPVRILLAGALVFLVAWFTVLRPKAPDITPAPPVATATGTPTDGLGRAVAKARGAAATAEAAGEAAAGETDTPATQAGSATKAAQSQARPAVAIPADVLAKLPKDVAAALTAHKTLVLGVIADGATPLRPLADDDRYVRNALRRANRYDGEVVVKRVPASSLVRYAPLVNGLKVNQTPSIVVIDGQLHGTVLTGYADRISINQVIADARANSVHPLIRDSYLRKVNTFCTHYYTAETRWSYPTIPGKPARVSSMNRRVSLEKRYRALFARIAAPARWRGLKRQYLAALGDYQRTLFKQAAAIKQGDHAAWISATLSFDPASSRKVDARFDKLGVTSCVIDRRS